MIGHVRVLRVCGALRAARKSVPEELLSAEWHAVEALKTAAEAPVAAWFADVLARQEAEVLARLPAVLPLAGGVPGTPPAKATPQESALGALLLDLMAWDALIDEELLALLRQVLHVGYLAGARRVGADADATSARLTPESLDVLRRVVALTQETTLTTQAQIGEIVVAALQAGQGPAEVSAALSRQFADWREHRARTVAQTTVTPTFERAQLDAFAEAGVKARRWLSMRDPRVRDGHLAADGQVAAMGVPFLVSGEALMHPGDPAGSARNTINCRCTVLPLLADASSATDEASAPDPAKGRRERPYIAERNAAIRAAYPGLRDAHGKNGAIYELSQRHCLAEDTINKILWPR